MKKVFVYGIVAAAAAVLIFKPREAACTEMPLLVAHRGANRLADENTLKAYSLASEFGMDYFECDPRLTKDGVFVLMHDAVVDRTTNGKGAVADMTLAQVKELRTKNDELVPTLEEALLLAKEKQIGVYLDTKLKEITDLEKLVSLVKKFDMGSRVVVGLWNSEGQKWMEKNHPDVSTSVAYPLAASGVKNAKESGAEWIGVIVPQATPAMIKKGDKYGVKIITLPINKKDVMLSKLKAGLQVIQTDDPAALREVVDEYFYAEGD